jgi:hypothetical protein
MIRYYISAFRNQDSAEHHFGIQREIVEWTSNDFGIPREHFNSPLKYRKSFCPLIGNTGAPPTMFRIRFHGQGFLRILNPHFWGTSMEKELETRSTSKYHEP